MNGQSSATGQLEAGSCKLKTENWELGTGNWELATELAKTF